MSNLSIYEKKWLDLVFEGRNQDYGAYQLRLQNPRTTLLSLLIGVLFFAAALSASILAMDKTEIAPPPLADPDVIVRVTSIDPPKPPAPEEAIVPLSEPDEEVTKERLIDPEIVKSDEDHDDVMTNEEAVVPVAPEGEKTDGQGTNTGQQGTAANTGNASGGTNTDGDAVITATLDRLPEFPGGIEKFLQYVGNNFREPDLSNTRVEESKAIKVIVSFVIEKDGSMTDIKVLRNPGHGLGEEAVRVLKSQKTKWKPGVKNGKPVRTLYTLPISIIPR